MDPQADPQAEADSWSDLAATVLALVVERWPPASEDQKTLCSLLQVGSGVRRALLASTGHASVRLVTTQQLQNVPAFSAWLPAHAGLVKQLRIHAGYDGTAAERDAIAANLAAAFQQCVEPPARSAGLTTRARAAAAARPPRMPLQLVALSLGLPSRDEVLRALPLFTSLPASTASLTRLQLTGPLFSRDAKRSVGAQARPLHQLSRLVNLRHLKLRGMLWRPDSCAFSDYMTHAAGSRLTCLSLDATVSSVSQLLPLVPPTLHTLALTLTPRDPTSSNGQPEPRDADWALVPAADAPNRPTSLDYSSLIHVRRLHVAPEASVPCCTGDRHAALAVHLPPQLTALRLLWPCSDILGLQQPSVLAELHLYGYCLSNTRLLQLLAGLLHTLQALSLTGDWDGRERAQDMTVDEARQLAAALGSASALTSLVLQQYRVATSAWAAFAPELEPDDVPAHERVGWCRELSKLSGLQKLSLSPAVFKEDVLHLTAMTALTGLHIESCSFIIRSYLDDAGFSTLCTSLAALQHLSLVEAGLRDARAVVDSVRSLTRLTCLELAQPLFADEDDGGIDDDAFEGRMCVRAADLPRLAPLTRLRRLTLPLHPDVSEEEIQEFCSGHMTLLAAGCVTGDTWRGLE